MGCGNRPACPDYQTVTHLSCLVCISWTWPVPDRRTVCPPVTQTYRYSLPTCPTNIPLQFAHLSHNRFTLTFSHTDTFAKVLFVLSRSWPELPTLALISFIFTRDTGKWLWPSTWQFAQWVYSYLKCRGWRLGWFRINQNKKKKNIPSKILAQSVKVLRLCNGTFF